MTIAAPERIDPTTTGSDACPTLLVVDDEEGPRESVKLLFSRQFNVRSVSSGEEALEVAAGEPITLAIVDIRMGGMSGIDVLRELKQINEGTEVIMLTAYETLSTARDAVRFGAAEYLGKPFEVAQLQKVVDRCLQRHRMLARNRDRVREDLLRAKNEFLAVLSHELNTPMNGIMGFIEILAQTGLDDEQRELLGDIRECSRDLISKLEDILDFARVSTHTYAPSRELFNPSAVLLRLLQRPGSRKQGVRTTVRISPDIPAIVWGPEYELQVLWMKLLDNAWKFTTEGEVAVELKWIPESVGELRFLISDTGIGITEKFLEQSRTAEPFVPGDSSSTRAHSGLGMGLALCYRLCQKLGSELKVERVPAGGTRCEFSVTVESAQADDRSGHP